MTGEINQGNYIMGKRYIVRTLAAAAVSVAAKLIIKKIQNNKAEEQSATSESHETAHPPQTS